MNIWAPLPNNTNTLYVVKIDDPAVGSSLEWTPDPGVRCRLYGLTAVFRTSAVVGVRNVYVSVVSGSDLIYRGTCVLAITANTTRGIVISPHTTLVGTLNGTDIHWGFSLGMYLIHGLRVIIGGINLLAGDAFSGGVVYVDCWSDMSVKIGG